MAEYDQGKNDQAIADFSAAIELNPEFAAIYNYRGLANLDKDNLPQAILNFTMAIQHNLRFADAYVNRAFAYGLDVDLVIPDLTKAIDSDPKCVKAYGRCGLVYKVLGSWDLALADLNMAIALNSEFADPYVSRGGIFSQQAFEAQARADSLPPGEQKAAAAALADSLASQASTDLSTYLRLKSTLTRAHRSRGCEP